MRTLNSPLTGLVVVALFAVTTETAFAQKITIPKITPNARSGACQAAIDQAVPCIKAINAGTRQCSPQQTDALQAQINKACDLAPSAPSGSTGGGGGAPGPVGTSTPPKQQN